MHGEPVGQSLDQIYRLIARETLRFFSNGRIIDCPTDLICQVSRILLRPKRYSDGQPLRSCTLFFWNPDASENLELLDVNLIGSRLVVHGARLPRSRRSTKKSWGTQSISYGGTSSCEPARIRRDVAEPPLLGLNFLSFLVTDILSR